MNEFTIFEFRDRDGNSLIERIGNSDISDLRKFMGKKIGKMDIALIWSVENEEDDYREILDFYDFHSDERFAQEKDRFVKNYNFQVEQQKVAEKQYETFKKDIKKAATRFKKDNIIGEFVATKTNIVAEFDPDIIDLDPTAEIPLLKTQFWTKVWRQYENLDKIKTFFDQTSEQFIFQSVNSKDFGYINMDNSLLEITAEPKDIENQVDFINSNLNANIGNYKLFEINGSFPIEKFYFDRNVMAMMLLQNNFYNNTLFLNESGEVLSKKIKDDKDSKDQIKTVGRYTITWNKFGPEFSDSVFLTFTNREQDIIVSIAKIPNESDIKDAVNIALFLLDEYSKQESTMIKTFKRGVSNFKITTVKKQVVTKERKTKIKLTQLREYAPDLFLEKYPILCTASKQPRVATAQEIADNDRAQSDNFLEYPFGSGKFYVCDTGFPGIKINTIDNDKIHKYVPCCYPKSQRDRVAKFQAEDAGIAPKKVVTKEYIFEVDKHLDAGRQGKLSEVLIQVLQYHHLDSDIYIRYGVTKSPQSIIDAMAMIKNYSDWIADPDKAKNEIVRDLLRNPDLLNAGLQSYTRKYMERALNKNETLTAANFHPIMEYYFKAVVIVIQGNDFARPTSYFGFIPNIRKRKNLIILYTHKDSDQVEVIGTYDKNFMISKQKSIVEFLKTKRQIYGFFSGTGYVMPRLAPISKLANAQYVDSFGKCRGYLIGSQSVYTVPSAPSNKPIVTDPKMSNTRKILDKLNLTPLYFESGIVYTKGFVLPSNSIFDLPSPPKDYIMPYILTFSDFILKSYESEKAAYEMMKGDRPVPSELKDVIKLGNNGKLFPLETIEIVSPNVVVLYTKEDEENYLESLKTRPIFRWQKLWKLEYVAGKTHWVIVDDSRPLVIKDLEKTPYVEGQLGYGVVENAKIGNGNLVRYPEEKYAAIQSISAEEFFSAEP